MPQPTLSFDGFLYGREVKIDRTGFCGTPQGGGPYHYLSNLDATGVPQPATCSDILNIPILGTAVGQDFDRITLDFPQFELRCLIPDLADPSLEKRLYVGEGAQLLVNDEVIAEVPLAWIEMDIECLGQGAASMVGIARGTVVPQTPLGEALLGLFKEYGGTDQIEAVLQVVNFQEYLQGLVGEYEYELTLYPAMHREILRVEDVWDPGYVDFGDARAFLDFQNVLLGGDVTFGGDFTETLGSVNVRRIMDDPGLPPAGVEEILPSYWRICTLLDQYMADLGLKVPMVVNPGALVVLHRPNSQAPWEIFSGATAFEDGSIVAKFIGALSDWTVGSTEPDNFVPPGFISGIVRDAGENPIEGVSVHACNEAGGFGYDAHSLANGSYLMKGVAAGEYIVSADADGYHKQYYDTVPDRANATPVQVAGPDTAKNIDFWLEEILTIPVCIPEDLVAAPGDPILVPVRIGCGQMGMDEFSGQTAIGPEEIISAQMEILFDGSLLAPVDIFRENTLLDSTWLGEVTVTYDFWEWGTLNIAIAGVTPLSPDSQGVLLWIGFVVSPFATLDEDCSPLEFESFMFNEGTPAVDWNNGHFCVAEPALVGDVSLNEAVTAFDASIVLRYRVGLTDLSEYPGLRLAVADVDRSGEVTPMDAVYILQYVVGIVSELPVPYDELLAKPVAATRSIWLGAPEPSSDGVLVPIYVDELAGILAGELSFSFDGATVEGIPSEQTTDYLFASHVSEGKVRVAFAGAASGSGTGALGYLRIDAPYEAFDAGALRLDRAALNDGGMVAQVVEREASPSTYRLSQNHPNPFNPYTSIRYELPTSGRVLLSVYNVRGQLVRTLVGDFRNAGVYTATWDGRDGLGRSVSSGMYFYRLESGTFRETKKMLLMK